MRQKIQLELLLVLVGLVMAAGYAASMNEIDPSKSRSPGADGVPKNTWIRPQATATSIGPDRSQETINAARVQRGRCNTKIMGMARAYQSESRPTNDILDAPQSPHSTVGHYRQTLSPRRSATVMETLNDHRSILSTGVLLLCVFLSARWSACLLFIFRPQSVRGQILTAEVLGMATARNRRKDFLALWLIFLCLIVILCPSASRAQLATASINGVVRDPSGAVIPGASVTIINVATGVSQTTRSDAAGDYVLLNIPAGEYNLRVEKPGFQTKTQLRLTLNVNQTTSFDFILPVGSTRQTVMVQAAAAGLQTSTSELGTAVTHRQVNNLPLNGRNFTQLLALTPGVSVRNTTQNSGGFHTNPTGVFVFPAVNGQTNRSDFFMLDGLNDQEIFSSTYTVAPIVDDIQEFKVDSHNSAEAGGVLGGIINVVTKSGTNQFHGGAWEFLRNNAFDARSPFAANTSPLHQNQFGANIGGPVILPHYNGRNRTFFFGSYEGVRIHTQKTSLDTIPTPEELNGDFSGLVGSNGNLIQIYNPFSTRPDPSQPGKLLRDPFPSNQVPAGLLDPHMVAVAKLLYPQPIATPFSGINYQRLTPSVQDTNEYNIRGDEQMGSKDTFWGRFTHLSAPATTQSSLPGFVSESPYSAYETGGAWTHSLNSTTVLQVRFGHNYGRTETADINDSVPAAKIAQTAGFATAFACGYNIGPETCYPGIGISGFTGWGTEYEYSETSNDWEAGATVSKVTGKHTLSFGFNLNYNYFESPLEYSNVAFSPFQTSNLETSTGGSGVASFLLGVPDNAVRRQVFETEHNGWVDGFYGQDSWKATDRLTVNMGLRYDVTFIPWYGRASDRSWSSGDYDFNNGTYILEHNAPACSATVFAPCLPGGTLPAHVVVSKTGSIYHNSYDNIQPRLGIAYRLGRKNVIRVSGGRYFDNWAAVFQSAQGFQGTWPGIGYFQVENLNQGLPDTAAENPFALASGGYPAATPFNQVDSFMNPLNQNPESWQWNFGIERQLTMNTVLQVNYVGSADTRTDLASYYNTAVTPGPGSPRSRAPYPYITATPYDWSVGRATYNSLQLSLSHRWSHGLSFLVSYTWSKAEDLGSDGWYGADGTNIQNAYDLDQNWSVAGYDVPHAFSASWTYQLPVGHGQRLSTHSSVLSHVIDNWQMNGIVTLTSGYPYTITAPNGIPNTGTLWERASQNTTNTAIANPSPARWFNTSAFVPPAPYTFGNVGRNSMRSDWLRDLDFSLFRDFPIGENKKFEFRAETFNLTNIPIWGFPDAGVTDQNFGRVFSTSNSARQIQLALKFYW